MNYDTETCYQAILTRDSRFDGMFYVGVGTTGIYCRTVCPSRKPLPSSCTYYPSAAAAEKAGYRPCLRCRPELAPGNARIDAVSRLAALAVDRIEAGALTEISVTALAERLGVSDRHLRRMVASEYGVTPIELAQTHRLLLAKRLLTDTDLPIIEVASASGFSSLRRFNALFASRYRLNPTDLRRSRKTALPDTLVCELAYRPPLDWHAIIDFLVGRTSCGIEAIEGSSYLRTVAVGKRQGWIAVSPVPDRNTLRVELSASLAPVLVPVLTRIRRLFDLNAEPVLIASRLGAIAEARPGLRVPGAFSGFEMAVRAILGQQITVKAASTLASRFANAFGEPIITPYPQLVRLTPTAERVAQSNVDEIAALGIYGSRSNAILTLARAVADGDITLEPGANVEEQMIRLKQLPGIGEWTAQYVAMRALGWPDAFPHTDYGILKAMNEKNLKRALERAAEWQPWRAYAAMHLWKSLETLETT